MATDEVAETCNTCIRRRKDIDGVNPADLPSAVDGLIELGTGIADGQEHARFVCPLCGSLWTVVSMTDSTHPVSFMRLGWMV